MFEKFSVIDLIKTRSASVCTFAGNIVKFNVQTAQELHFPEYIQFLIEPKSKQFANQLEQMQPEIEDANRAFWKNKNAEAAFHQAAANFLMTNLNDSDHVF